jgi:hypothetical protein
MIRMTLGHGILGLGLVLSACGGDSSTAPRTTPSILPTVTTVTFAGVQGGASPGSQTVDIRDGVTGTLAGLKVEGVTYTGTSGWLTASLDKTTAPATLTLSATTGPLASGSYAASVGISATGASNSPLHIAVNLLVLGGAQTTSLTAAGQSVVFLDTPNLGTQLTLPAGSQYLIAVVNTDTAAAATEDFTLAGVLMSSGAVASVAAPVPLPASRYVEAPGTTGPRYAMSPGAAASLAVLRRLAPNHLAMLDRNRRIYARVGNPRTVRARLRAAGRVAPISAAITTTIGAVNKVYVAKQLTGGDCTTVDSIGARTVAVGQHVIVLADTNLTTWPQSQRPDSAFYQTFTDEYDQVTWPHMLTYVGDPLAYDANLSGAGKVTVTITPLLNNLGGGIVAFVNSCDFLPFAASGPDAALSNDTEMFYYWAPGTNGFTVPFWEELLRATAAHETKHIVSFTDRILNGSLLFEDIWLEEGLAQESSEIWLRHFNQATWKGGATFAQTVACELDLGSNAPCDAGGTNPGALVFSHLPFLFEYLQEESQSNSGALGRDTPANYGAGWAFARWATDQYAGNEGTFIQSLVNEPTLDGLANLSSHTGQPIPLLLMYWNLASAVYTTPTHAAADPRTTIPSFNFADIFRVGQTGLTCNGSPCGLFTFSGTPVFPVQPIAVQAGAISQRVTGVPGTAAAFFLLSAANAGTEALQLESGTGGTLPTTSKLRVGMIRVN